MPLSIEAIGVMKDPATGEMRETELNTCLIGPAYFAIAKALMAQFEKEAKSHGCEPVLVRDIIAKGQGRVFYPLHK